MFVRSLVRCVFSTRNLSIYLSLGLRLPFSANFFSVIRGPEAFRHALTLRHVRRRLTLYADFRAERGKHVLINGCYELRGKRRNVWLVAGGTLGRRAASWDCRCTIELREMAERRRSPQPVFGTSKETRTREANVADLEPLLRAGGA